MERARLASTFIKHSQPIPASPNQPTNSLFFMPRQEPATYENVRRRDYDVHSPKVAKLMPDVSPSPLPATGMHATQTVAVVLCHFTAISFSRGRRQRDS